MAVYAVSDLHGRLDVFMRGLEKIEFGDADRLYVIGDAIDRGPDGIGILQYIRSHDNMDLIIGNHEFMMLNSVDPGGRKKCPGRDADLWLYYNGGTKTYEQYERLPLMTKFELLFWLNSRLLIKTLIVNDTAFCLTHSFYIPDCENRAYNEMNYDTIWEIVWKSIYRNDRETHCTDIYELYDYKFITGHVPVQRIYRDMDAPISSWARGLKPFVTGNLINIDGGCAGGYNEVYDTGAIFLRLDDMQSFPVLITS
ncbi:MAG: fructose-bisphosphatase class III [Lachnospiraceae bacterium]|nr:fructose-bisphosphatase class III [Lachnospiraceae bacterium]